MRRRGGRTLRPCGGTGSSLLAVLAMAVPAMAGVAAGATPTLAQETGPEASAALTGSEGLRDFEWLTGTWLGEGPGGSSAEIHFMAPEAGVIPAVFRLWRDGRTIVLEAMTLVREEDRVVMYVRHFDPALVPMEKERAIELVLVGREGDAFLFENANEGQNPVRSVMTRTPDGFTSVSDLLRSDGTKAEIRSAYRRAPGG